MQSTDSPDLTIATPIGDVRLYASEQDRASMWLDHIMVNRIEYSLHGDIERRAPYPRNIYTRRVLAPGDYGKTEPTPGASRTIYAAVRAMIAGLTDAQWGALNRAANDRRSAAIVDGIAALRAVLDTLPTDAAAITYDQALHAENALKGLSYDYQKIREVRAEAMQRARWQASPCLSGSA